MLLDQTAIVILNFNGKKHLETYLPSVIKYSVGCKIIVIDNCSTDDSVSFLKTHYPTVEIIINDKNYGFAGGYNKGLEKVNATYLVLLNSDVEVTENWLIDPLKELSHSDIAACQPKIRAIQPRENFEYAGASGGFIDKYGFPFCRGRIFDNAEKDRHQYDSPIEIFWATGACMFVKSKLFFDAGGFDADFFAHMEEIDLCWRFKLMGYKIMVIPSSTVHHLGGGTLQYNSPFKTRLNFRNNLFLLQKNLQYNRFSTIFIRMCLDGIAAMRFLLTGKFNHFGAVFKAHMQFYGSLKKNKLKRKQFETKIRIGINQKLTGMIDQSIVRGYFIKGKKLFTDYVK